METGFIIEAAKPKGLRDADDQPATVPMRPRQVLQKNPTTDQKKVRRQMARQQRTAGQDGSQPQDDWEAHQRNQGPVSHDIECETCGATPSAWNMWAGVRPGDHGSYDAFTSPAYGWDHEQSPTGWFCKDHHPHADRIPELHGMQGPKAIPQTRPFHLREHYDHDSPEFPYPTPADAPRHSLNSLHPRTATEIPSSADKLRPGDVIRGPNNTTVNVRQVRLHKADASKVLIDTDSGTIMVPRTQSFTLVPVNMRQREIPDQGPVAASPVTNLPMGGRGQGDMHGGAGGNKTCPVCGSEMQMRRAGQNALYVCPRDGYSTQANGLGATSDPDMLPQRRSTLQTEADLRGKDCRVCGGNLVTDAVDHRESTVHAHCEDCGTEHQLQNAQHSTGSAKTAAVPFEERDPNEMTGHCLSGNHDECEDYPDTTCVCPHHDHWGVPNQYRESWKDEQYHPEPFDMNAVHPAHTAAKKNSYITTTANTKSAIARRAQSVLNLPEGSL